MKARLKSALVRQLPAIIGLWGIINGVLISQILQYQSRRDYVDSFLSAVIQSATSPESSQEAKVIALTKATHDVVTRFAEFVPYFNSAGFDRWQIRGLDRVIEMPIGACGDAANLLARLLLHAGMEIRIGQMHCKEGKSCHIFTEVQINGRWVFLDGLFNLTLRNSSGLLATFDEFLNENEFFQDQLPPHYEAYRHPVGVQYTNWEKIPVLMPGLRRALVAYFGEEVIAEISLRAHFLKVNSLISYSLAAGLFIFNLASFWIWRRVIASKKIPTKVTTVVSGSH